MYVKDRGFMFRVNCCMERLVVMLSVMRIYILYVPELCIVSSELLSSCWGYYCLKCGYNFYIHALLHPLKGEIKSKEY